MPTYGVPLVAMRGINLRSVAGIGNDPVVTRIIFGQSFVKRADARRSV